MSIVITVAQRCGGEYGQSVYFAEDTTATFSLDGNADNAQMMAGYALDGIVRAHRGDTLLVTVRLYGDLVARWVGVASTVAADELSAFVNGRMKDYRWTAVRIHNRLVANGHDLRSA